MRVRHDALLDLEEAEKAVRNARFGLQAFTDDGLDAFRVGVLYAIGRLERLADGLVDANEPEERRAEERVH